METIELTKKNVKTTEVTLTDKKVTPAELELLERIEMDESLAEMVETVFDLALKPKDPAYGETEHSEEEINSLRYTKVLYKLMKQINIETKLSR